MRARLSYSSSNEGNGSVTHINHHQLAKAYIPHVHISS
jgi:hypothetical protein